MGLQAIVLFEIIGQVSNTFVNITYYDEFHIAIFMVSNNLNDELVGLNVLPRVLKVYIMDVVMQMMSTYFMGL